MSKQSLRTTPLARRGTAVSAGVLAALLAGCSAAPPDEDVPHGYVEGAEETAEAQSRLVIADAESGAVTVLDLTTEDAAPLGTVAGPRGIDGDGRFGYVTAADGSTRIVDTGAWRVDHGDHVHYYRAAIRDVGDVPGEGPVTAHSDPSVVAVSGPRGAVTLLDRAALDRGEIAVGGELPAGQGPAVALAGHVIGVSDDRPDGLSVRNAQGAEVAAVDERCPQPEGQAVTKRGAVFGCADGAVLVSEKDGAFTSTRIPYPRPVAADERARAFTLRPGSSTLAARAGADGVWSLDLGRKTWTHVATGPAVAVNTVGERGPVLALDPQGVLHAFDPVSGERKTQRPLIDAVDPAANAGGVPRIEIDTTRAYINDPSSGAIHEIDFGDGLREARTLHVAGRASFMIETGR